MLKQSTARNLMVLMTSSTDHITGATGLSLTITASRKVRTTTGTDPER